MRPVIAEHLDGLGTNQIRAAKKMVGETKILKTTKKSLFWSLKAIFIWQMLWLHIGLLSLCPIPPCWRIRFHLRGSSDASPTPAAIVRFFDQKNPPFEPWLWCRTSPWPPWQTSKQSWLLLQMVGIIWVWIAKPMAGVPRSIKATVWIRGSRTTNHPMNHGISGAMSSPMEARESLMFWADCWCWSNSNGCTHWQGPTKQNSFMISEPKK